MRTHKRGIGAGIVAWRLIGAWLTGSKRIVGLLALLVALVFSPAGSAFAATSTPTFAIIDYVSSSSWTLSISNASAYVGTSIFVGNSATPGTAGWVFAYTTITSANMTVPWNGTENVYNFTNVGSPWTTYNTSKGLFVPYRMSLNGGSSWATFGALPPAPPTLSGTPSEGAVTLSWTASSNASSYVVYQDGLPIATSVTGLTYKVTGLHGLSAHTYSVAGENASATGAQSNAVTVTAIPPVQLTASGGQGVITGSLSGGAAPYTVSAATYTWTIQSSGSSFSEAVPAGSYTVMATDANGFTSSVNVTVQKPVAPAPTGVTQSGTPGGSGSISWNPAPNAPPGTVYTVTQNGTPIGSTSGSSLPVSNYNPNAVYGVGASAPGYISAAPQTQYGHLGLAFTPLDIITNAAALVWGIGGFLLLMLALLVAPRLVALIRAGLSRGKESESGVAMMLTVDEAYWSSEVLADPVDVDVWRPRTYEAEPAPYHPPVIPERSFDRYDYGRDRND